MDVNDIRDELYVLECLNDILNIVSDSLMVGSGSEKELSLQQDDTDEDDKFNWEDYLKSVGCLPVGARSFWHVEQSLSVADFKPGHLVALVSDNYYWPAEIVSTCHNNLELIPLSSRITIWKCIEDHLSVQALSLARQHSLSLTPFETLDVPPSVSTEDVERWMSLKGWASESAFEGNCNLLPFERIEVGQFVDVQSEVDPRNFWPCEILENVGGRLLLKYSSSQPSTGTFWEFYLSERVHPAGVIEKCEHSSMMGWKYSPPDGVELHQDIQQIVQSTSENSVFDYLFESREPLQTHNFELNMKMEALHPFTRRQFFPASVVEILNDYYFVIELDCHHVSPQTQRNVKKICHKGTLSIFPVNWCAQKRLRMAVAEDFEWGNYIKRKGGRMATECHFPQYASQTQFYRGQKLEAVNPFANHQICVATIARFVRPLLWIHLDSLPHFTSPFAVHESSTNLFPCGWSQSVSYPLKLPFVNHQLSKTNEKIMEKADYGFICISKRSGLWPETFYTLDSFLPRNGCQWSPAIYFNPKCYVGPYIDEQKLCEMPKQIGPGPCHLVLEKVLSHLISASLKPRDLFLEFQPDPNQPYNPDLETIEVKAKYRKKSCKGTAEICQKIEHVQEWCRQLCILLEACPSLVALYSRNVTDDSHCCPYECKKICENKPSSIMKNISTVFAKKLQKRIGTRNRQYESDGQSLSKRRRIIKETNFVSRDGPITRGVQLQKFDFVQSRPRRAAQRYAHLNGYTSATTDSEASQNLDTSYAVETAMSHDVAITRTLNGTKEDLSNANINIPPVRTDPVYWSSLELYHWLVETEVCKNDALKLKEEHVDGQAFMLLTLEDVQKFLNLKLGPALKLCVVIEHLKTIFLTKFARLRLSVNQ